MPSLRGAQLGSGVVSQPKRTPRSEGVPPSIEFRMTPRDGKMPSIQGTPHGPGVVPGARASRPRLAPVIEFEGANLPFVMPSVRVAPWRCPVGSC